MTTLWKRSRARTGGRLVVDALRAHAVDAVFCVPGESYLPILDALRDVRDDITVVTCRHEQGAADMAEAYGKLTGRPGVCLVTRGPGACNASIGVHTAFQDSTPMVVLVGQVARAHLGREAFQEVDVARMFAPLAKHAVQADGADELPRLIADAFCRALSNRPGPVVVALPEDVLAETAEVADVAPRQPVAPELDPGLIERFHHVLGDAERPLMIVGGSGWSERARKDIDALVTANALPTCCSFRRHDIVDNRLRAFIGELGIAPGPALVERVKAADVVLAVGTRLGEIVTQGYTLIEPGSRRPTLVHVHPDIDELGRVYEPALAIPAGMPAFAAAVRALPPAAARWRAWADAARADYLADTALPASASALDLGRVMAELEETLTTDAVVTVDAGNFSGWPQRFLRFGGGRRLLGAANGAMGYAVPAAVAAKILDAERMVIACVGDGGFGMTGQELSTAVRYGVAPLILVFNNGMYGTIRMHQERRHPGRAIATRLVNPDFAALARAYGAHGETVERTEQFGPALRHALAAGRAAVIELRMDPDVISTRTTLSALRLAAKRGEPLSDPDH